MEPKVFTAYQLSNEAYHADTEYVTGSVLCAIHKTCPAKWYYGERKETKALLFGTGSHAALLEPEKFDAEFYRAVDAEQYPHALRTVAEMKKAFTERGIKGLSAADKATMLEKCRELEIVCLDHIEQEHDAANAGKVKLSASEYDMIQQMRAVIVADDAYSSKIVGGWPEMSIFAELEGVKVKIRPDLMTTDGGIWDYKTCTDLQKFARDAFEFGYYLKMALQHDVFQAAYGTPPSEVVLLAQEKTAPFIPQALRMTPEQLQIGRMQYKSALALYKACKESDIWPAYGGGIQELETPDYVKRMYNIK
jgi:hypothetical protein